jgi:hypothetical protein
MNPRKTAAAVSAVGAFLVAGCGGKAGGGGALPAVPGQLTQGTQPANSSKVTLAIAIPVHASQAWSASSALRQPSQRRVGTGRYAREIARRPSQLRQPQYVSPAVLGGSVYVYVYQGSSLALTDGPFSVGTTPSSQIYCYTASGFPYACYNTVPVFAPYGNDSFFVAMYDSQHRLLSITPGMPGSNFISATPATYTITPAGYPAPIELSSYAVVSTFGVDTATSCVLYDADPVVATDMFDASGYFLSYGAIANPFTINVTGGFTLYETSPVAPYIQAVSTPYTISNISGASFLTLIPQGPGATGTVSVTSSAGNVSVNGAAAQMNLYAVDRIALSPSAAGLSAVGLVDSGPSAFDCGTMYLATYDTGTPISFSSTAAIGADDFYPGAVVIDNVSGTPFANVLDLNPPLFGLGFQTYRFQDAVPAIRGPLPGSNALEVAVSPYAAGNAMIYVLNQDGSITRIDELSATASLIEPAGTIAGPTGIDVLWNDGGTGDVVFAGSSTTSTIYEVTAANTTPSLGGTSIPFGVSPVAYSVAVDNVSGDQYVAFQVFDAANYNAYDFATCYGPICSLSLGHFTLASGSYAGPQSIGIAYQGGVPYALMANGNGIANFVFGLFPISPTTTFPSFSGPVTRVLSTYDGLWNGVGTGASFQFFYNLGGSAMSATLPGSRGAIVSP